VQTFDVICKKTWYLSHLRTAGRQSNDFVLQSCNLFQWSLRHYSIRLDRTKMWMNQNIVDGF